MHVLEMGPDEDVTALWELPWRFQAGFLQGRGGIGTTLVDCVTVDVQLLMHTGYALPTSHVRDVELLE